MDDYVVKPSQSTSPGRRFYDLPSPVRILTVIISVLLSLVLYVEWWLAGIALGVGENQEPAQIAHLHARATFPPLAASLWILGAAVVMPKPRISTSIYVAAGVLLLYGGGQGCGDCYISAAASASFALMSWRGAKEIERSDE